jgi:hypothetical protein
MPDREIQHARTLSKVLDHFLVDPILGLILPGAGDVAGSLMGLYTVGVALRRRMSPVIIARMLLNLALDAILGVVPLLGDIADVAYQANQRNVKLLEQRATTGRATARDWLMVVGAALLFVGAVVGTVYLGYRLVSALANAL